MASLIALVDGGEHAAPALRGGLARLDGLLLDTGDLLGDGLVADAVAQPGRVVALAEMVVPGVVVDALGDVQEQAEGGRPQVQPPVRALEPEALGLVELALR